MCAFPALTSLKFSCVSCRQTVLEGMLSRLGCLANLEDLELDGWPLLEATAGPEFPALTRLALDGVSPARVGFARMPQLQQLSVRDAYSWDAADLSALSALRALSSLHLALPYRHGWRSAAEVLGQAPPSLVSLSVESREDPLAKSHLASQLRLDSVPQLTRLELRGPYWLDLAPLKSLQLLEVPDRRSVRFPKSGWPALPQLRCLRLGGKAQEGPLKAGVLKVGRRAALCPPRRCRQPSRGSNTAVFLLPLIPHPHFCFLRARRCSIQYCPRGAWWRRFDL